MSIKKKTFVFSLIAAVLAGALIMFGASELLNSLGVGTVRVSAREYKHLEYMDKKYAKVEELWQAIEDNYYKDVNEKDLKTGMYRGLFDGLDDIYSTYMTKKEYESWNASTIGEFEGVGITFTEDKNGNYVVVSTVDGSPAQKGGIKAGDYILKVDGKKYHDLDSLGAAMRGTKGTEVKITYLRDDSEKTVTLTRAKIVTETVSSKVLDGNIGYIKISSFEENTASDFKTVLNEMEEKNVDGLVIDLRDNGGGLVEQGAKIADMLMGKGTITYMQDREGKREYYRSDSSKTDLPYVLLVNGGTASTSEILSAAVKDSGDGTLVGTKTFGKGIVQSTAQLDDGSAYKLTVMQYFSPDGHVINKKGVKPDYVIKQSDSSKTDRQLNKALDLLK